MQRKHMMIIIVLCVMASIVSVIFYALVSGREFSTYVCTETVALNPHENQLLEFYVPKGSATGIKFDFVVSDGSVKYAAEPSSHFADSQEFLQFLTDYPMHMHDVYTGPTGMGWSGVDCATSTPFDLSNDFVGQIWYLYLSNEASYAKDVSVDVSKTWKLW